MRWFFQKKILLFLFVLERETESGILRDGWRSERDKKERRNVGEEERKGVCEKEGDVGAWGWNKIGNLIFKVFFRKNSWTEPINLVQTFRIWQHRLNSVNLFDPSIWFKFFPLLISSIGVMLSYWDSNNQVNFNFLKLESTMEDLRCFYCIFDKLSHIVYIRLIL